MNSHLVTKLSRLGVANLRNSQLLRALCALILDAAPTTLSRCGYLIDNLLRPELIRGSLGDFSMFNNHHSLPKQNYQSGVALILSLIILTMMTMIGVTALQSASVEEKMSSNVQQLNTAFQAAEAALRDGEYWIDEQTRPPLTEDCVSKCGVSSKVWSIDSGFLDGIAGWTTTDWHTHAFDLAGFPYKYRTPQRLIQEHSYERDSVAVGIATPTASHYYQVSARGTGGTGKEDVRLQSIFIKRFN